MKFGRPILLSTLSTSMAAAQLATERVPVSAPITLVSATKEPFFMDTDELIAKAQKLMAEIQAPPVDMYERDAERALWRARNQHKKFVKSRD